MVKNKVKYIDYGLGEYKELWEYQTELHKEIVKLKLENRHLEPSEKHIVPHYFILCQHPHVYTLGKSGKQDHLLLNQDELIEKEAQFVKINRGGDITYHGPGQLVGYPILDLDEFFTDVHRYVRSLEEVIIRTVAEYGIVAGRVKEYTGVWIDEKGSKRKICAIGVHLSRWVTMHGFALNVNSQLQYFDNIIPCGINDADKEVTSIQKEIGEEIDLKEVQDFILKHFSEVFECEIIN